MTNDGSLQIFSSAAASLAQHAEALTGHAKRQSPYADASQSIDMLASMLELLRSPVYADSFESLKAANDWPAKDGGVSAGCYAQLAVELAERIFLPVLVASCGRKKGVAVDAAVRLHDGEGLVVKLNHAAIRERWPIVCRQINELPAADFDLIGEHIGKESQRAKAAQREAVPKGQQGNSERTTDSRNVLEGLPESQKNIMAVIDETGHRLTQMEIAEALGKKGLDASVGMLKQNLAVMVNQTHILTNRSDTKPRGYGLSEWSDES